MAQAATNLGGKASPARAERRGQPAAGGQARRAPTGTRYSDTMIRAASLVLLAVLVAGVACSKAKPSARASVDQCSEALANLRALRYQHYKYTPQQIEEDQADQSRAEVAMRSCTSQKSAAWAACASTAKTMEASEACTSD